LRNRVIEIFVYYEIFYKEQCDASIW